MNRISEYFGSGQRSSATTFSSLSAASRTFAIAAIWWSRAYSASFEALDAVGVLVGLVELADRRDQLFDERLHLAGDR